MGDGKTGGIGVNDVHWIVAASEAAKKQESAPKEYDYTLAGDKDFQITCKKLHGILDAEGCFVKGFYLRFGGMDFGVEAPVENADKQDSSPAEVGESVSGAPTVEALSPNDATVEAEVEFLIPFIGSSVPDAISALAKTWGAISPVRSSGAVVGDRGEDAADVVAGSGKDAPEAAAVVKDDSKQPGSADELKWFLEANDQCQRIPAEMGFYDWSEVGFPRTVYEYTLNGLNADAKVHELEYLELYSNLKDWAKFFSEKIQELKDKKRSNEHVALEGLIGNVAYNYWLDTDPAKDSREGLTEFRDVVFSIASDVVACGDKQPFAADVFIGAAVNFGDDRIVDCINEYVTTKLSAEESLEHDTVFYSAVYWAKIAIDLESMEGLGEMLAQVKSSPRTPQNVLNLF